MTKNFNTAQSKTETYRTLKLPDKKMLRNFG